MRLKTAIHSLSFALAASVTSLALAHGLGVNVGVGAQARVANGMAADTAKRAKGSTDDATIKVGASERRVVDKGLGIAGDASLHTYVEGKRSNGRRANYAMPETGGVKVGTEAQGGASGS